MATSRIVAAVVGAGNVGCALAAHLSLLGVEVRLCTRSEARLSPIRDAGAIKMTGAVSGVARIATLTTSLDEAVDGAHLVAVTVPSPALSHYAAALTSVITAKQVLWLDPGHGGALYLATELRRSGNHDRELRICQLSTASHSCRMASPTTVEVFGLPPALLAAFPARHVDECYEPLAALFPGQFDTVGSVLEVDLMNINPVMHPAQMVCNAGWIQATGGDFYVYQEGTVPAVAQIIEAVDAERLEVTKPLAVPAAPFAELMLRSGRTTQEAASTGRVHVTFQAGEQIRAFKAPSTLNHRYLQEDVGWGLVPWMALARSVGVATPTMGALTHLASIINNIDYEREGLTLDKMGLSGMCPDEITEYVRNGHRPVV